MANRYGYVSKFLISIIGIPLILLSSSPAARSAQLAISNIDDSGEFNVLTDEIFISLSMAEEQPNPGGVFPLFFLFEDFTFTSADIGKTFTATSSNDSDFDEFAGLITNGDTNAIVLSSILLDPTSGENFGTIWETSERFFFDLDTVDFEGAEIDSIDLVINSLTFDSPEYAYNIDIVVNGQSQSTPENNSNLSLIAFGIFGIASTIKYKLKWKSKQKF